jgi:hypothetical protein
MRQPKGDASVRPLQKPSTNPSLFAIWSHFDRNNRVNFQNQLVGQLQGFRRILCRAPVLTRFRANLLAIPLTFVSSPSVTVARSVTDPPCRPLRGALGGRLRGLPPQHRTLTPMWEVDPFN